MADLIPTKELVKWGEKNVVDGIIQLINTPENKRYATQYLRHLITESGIKTDKGKPSKPSNFPKVFFDGELTPFRNKAKEGNLTVNKFNFTSAESHAKSDLKRSENLFSLTKMEDVQLDFLIEAQKIKDEYKNNPSPNAEKKSNKQMEALFRKYKRIYVGKDKDGQRQFFRSGDYDSSKWESYGLPEWYADLPEGTNIKDVYKKWKRDVDRNTNFSGQSKGHVYPASQGGASAPSNLVGEDHSGNYASQDKAGTFRSKEDLAKINVAYSGPMALQEFLTEYDPSVVSPTRFLETDRSRLNTDLTSDIQGLESEFEDNLFNYNRANFLSLGPDPTKSHLLKQITSETINAYENRHIRGVSNLAATGLEHSVNFYTGSKLGTNIRTGLKIGRKLKDKDVFGALLESTNLESTTISPYYGLSGK